MEESKIVIYNAEDGQTQIDVCLENETLWLTEEQIAGLFGTKRPAITKLLKISTQLSQSWTPSSPR